MIWPRQFCRLETLRMAHVHFKFLHLAFKIVSSAIIFIFSLQRSENSQLQIPNQQRTVQHLLSSARTTAERDTILFRKRRQAVVAVVYFSRGGTGWLLFFFSTGRDGALFFFFFEGRDGTVVFGGGILAGRGKIVTPSRQRRFKPSRQPSM